MFKLCYLEMFSMLWKWIQDAVVNKHGKPFFFKNGIYILCFWESLTDSPDLIPFIQSILQFSRLAPPTPSRMNFYPCARVFFSTTSLMLGEHFDVCSYSKLSYTMSYKFLGVNCYQCNISLTPFVIMIWLRFRTVGQSCKGTIIKRICKNIEIFVERST